MTAKIFPMPNIRIVPKEQLGIDNIKQSFAFILDVTNKGLELIKDFKWPGSFPKLLEFGFTLSSVQGMKSIFRKALEEFQDLDARESKEVADYIQVHFDISNDELEALIEEGIELLPEIYATILNLVATYSKVENYFARFKKPDQIGLAVTIRKTKVA